MPPRRKASGETTAAGSSRKGRKSSSGRNEPTDSGKEVQEKTPSQRLLFVAYHRFRHRSRPLDRDEILGMAAITLTKETEALKGIQSLLRRFDNPNDDLRIELENSISTNDQQLLSEVAGMFETYVQTTEGAEDKCRNLDGLTKRLPNPTWLTLPKSAGKEARLDQFALCYAILHFCRDHERKRLGPSMYTDVLEKKVFNNMSSISKSILKKLTNEKDPWNRYFTVGFFQDQEFAQHFEKKAQELFTEYELAEGKLEPVLVIPSKPSTLEPDLRKTTTAVEVLSLTATASGSREPTKISTGKDNFEDMFDWERYGAQDTRVSSSPPAESSDSEPAGKGKGKEKEKEKGKGKGKEKEKQGRERESSSNSPGKGGSGKPEGKKPRREGKK